MAALCIQCWWRRVTAQKRYQLVRGALVGVQAIARGLLARKKFAEVRANASLKRFGALPPQFGTIEKMTTIQLARFDLNDPSTLAAFADEEDSFADFDSTDVSSIEELEDVDAIEERDEEVEEEEAEDKFVESHRPRLHGKRLTKKKGGGEGAVGHGEIDLDASFILEDARLKLIG